MALMQSELDVDGLADVGKAMSNPLRIRIMAELNLQPMSPTMFFNECDVEGHSVSTIAKHFRKLEQWGLIVEVEQKSGKGRRGAVETFYRATKHTVFDEITWPAIPAMCKRQVSAEIIRAFFENVKTAFEAGTIDARDDQHISWTAFQLDLRGWKEMIGVVDRAFYETFTVADEASERLKASGEEPIQTTVAFMGFESGWDK